MNAKAALRVKKFPTHLWAEADALTFSTATAASPANEQLGVEGSRACHTERNMYPLT